MPSSLVKIYERDVSSLPSNFATNAVGLERWRRKQEKVVSRKTRNAQLKKTPLGAQIVVNEVVACFLLRQSGTSRREVRLFRDGTSEW